MLTSLNEIQKLTKQFLQTQTKPKSQFTQAAFKKTIQRIIQCCVRENLLPFSIKNNRLTIDCKKTDSRIICEHITLYSCMRIDFNSDILIQNKHLKAPIDSLMQLFKILESEFIKTDTTQLKKFISEVNNSFENMSQMLEHVHNTRRCLKSLFGDSDLMDLTHKLPINGKALFFEQWASQGHPFHPCIKVKFGLDNKELRTYCPEFSPEVTISLYAIHNSLSACELENNDSLQKFFSKNYPEYHVKFQQYLNENGVNADDFYPLFIHPWQEQHILPKLYSIFLKTKRLIKIPTCAMALKPSLSFRTLYSDKNSYQIKLPTTVLCTGAIRTLSRNTIHNSPRISKILRDILENKTSQLDKLHLLYDSVAIRINTNDFETDKQLGMLFRDSIAFHINKSETPVITAALFSESLKDNTPLLCEIINSFYKTKIASKNQATDYFKKLCQIILEPNLCLYLKHGIALEGHQQNSMIVFKDNIPKSILIKDLGGVRIHNPTLNQSGYTLTPYPDSVTVTDDLIEVRNKLFHAAYQSLLAELIILLVREYHLDEVQLWKIVKEKTLAILKDCASSADQYNLESKALVQSDWPIKSFVAMRLANTYADYIYSSTKNPMNSEGLGLTLTSP